MIITKQKELETILECIKNARTVFLIGCSLCATTCRTGGENELKDMEKVLVKQGKTVTGWVVLDPACNLLEIKRLYRKRKEEIDTADAILSFACGGGSQAILEIIPDKEVVACTDTLFQGEITKLTPKGGQFDQKCSLCGECGLSSTGGICPVTRCPKGLLNGPCGGVKEGKCEVDRDLDCVWILIYERLKKLGRLDDIKKARAPKDHRKNSKPQSLNI